MAVRSIPIWRGGEIAAKAIVDEQDFEKVSDQVWYLMTDSKHRKRRYAQASVKSPEGKWRTVMLHRVVLGLTARTPDVDHIDGDGLNNRRSNLRPATRSQNNQNMQAQRKPGKSSRFRGVCWNKPKQRWQARVKVHGKTVFSRCFQTEGAAARAVAAARAKWMPFSQEALALQRSA